MSETISITVDGKTLKLSPEEFLKQIDNNTLKVISFDHESNKQFKDFVDKVRNRFKNS